MQERPTSSLVQISIQLALIVCLVSNPANAAEPADTSVPNSPPDAPDAGAIRKIVEMPALLPGHTPVIFVKRAPTKYPKNMRKWGLQGDGLVLAVIGKDGKPRDVEVLKSPHPAFESAIVRTVVQSEYKPATKNGEPVAIRISIPFRFRFDREFQMEERTIEQDAPFMFPNKPGASLPAELQYDAPPEIKIVAPIVYPRELLQKDVTGRAKVVVILDDRGRVQSVKVAEASHPEFGAATTAMMRAWQFSPAMKDGKRIATMFAYEQKFRWSERDSGVNNFTESLLKGLDSKRADIVEMDALDNRPKALYQPSPVDHRVGDVPPEEVLIEFFIDPEGGVQLPRIISAKDPELGWAAATAIKRWIFEVPTVKGEPVYARRELRFDFK